MYQVDPFGARETVVITHGSQGGGWEAFDLDTRNPNQLFAFLTEDVADGAVQRMTIQNPDYTNSWDVLLGNGPVDYLFLEPKSFFDRASGTFRWTSDEAKARANAERYYPKTEGLEMDGNILRVVSKELEGFFDLDLDSGTYTFEEIGFDGQPDQTKTILQDDGSKVMYFTEEAQPVLGLLGAQAGIYTRDEAGKYTNIIFGDDYTPGKSPLDLACFTFSSIIDNTLPMSVSLIAQ